MRCPPSLIIAFTVLAAGSPLRAQDFSSTSELRPGTRVRFDAPGIVGDHLVATVISHTSDTLKVASQSVPTIAVPMTRITRLEISRGDSRAAGALHGMKWGVPIGLGFGVLALAISNDCTDCQDAVNRGAVVPAFGLAGAFYGAIIGAIVQHERWAPFQVSPRVSFRTGAQRAGLALRVGF